MLGKLVPFYFLRSSKESRKGNVVLLPRPWKLPQIYRLPSQNTSGRSISNQQGVNPSAVIQRHAVTKALRVRALAHVTGSPVPSGGRAAR